VIDFADPTPRRGLGSHLSLAAEERLQCELVVAFGLCRRLLQEKHLRLDQILEGLVRFTKRWVVVDFEWQQADRFVATTDVPHYGREEFIEALGKRFGIVNEISGAAGSVFLCTI
jgi:hypothetical protein